MKTPALACVVLTSLVSFAVAAPPKKAEKVSARDLLAKFDANNDRKLDKTELSTALRSLKFNQYSTKNDSWKQFDTDKDAMLESKELDALLDANAIALAKSEEEAAKAEAAKTKEKPTGGLKLRPNDP
jgi:hypothetical protein